MGHYPAPPGWPSQIPGLEYAGTVELRGPGSSRWQTGDRVMGLVGGGAHAEAVVVREDEAIPIPRALSYAEAAAIPEAFLTAWDALVHRARVSTGDRVLIHAVGSGVGTAAVQLGAVPRRAQRRHLAHARRSSTGSWSWAWTKPSTRALGRSCRSFRETVHALIDCLGGPVLKENLAALLPRGRLVLIGHLLGGRGEMDLGVVLRQRLEIIGTVMRSRDQAERATLVREFVQEVLPAFAISPAVARDQAPAGRRHGAADDETGPRAPADGEERDVREGGADLDVSVRPEDVRRLDEGHLFVCCGIGVSGIIGSMSRVLPPVGNPYSICSFVSRRVRASR